VRNYTPGERLQSRAAAVEFELPKNVEPHEISVDTVAWSVQPSRVSDIGIVCGSIFSSDLPPEVEANDLAEGQTTQERPPPKPQYGQRIPFLANRKPHPSLPAKTESVRVVRWML